MNSVTVLMSTYNGEKYIKEQLDSIIKQKDVKLNILVRDDGSVDSTTKILDEYKEKNLLSWYTGENLKSAKSFMNIIHSAPDSEYYAFSDQDDVWDDDKLKKAIDILNRIGEEDTPKLYCSNYQLVDSNLNELGDNGHVSTTTFNAALVSSSCTGCTVVFNKALIIYLKMFVPEIILMHDDWVHKVCLAIGGTVYYDNSKTLKYRQHGNNVDGGIRKVSVRVKKIIDRIVSKDCIRCKQIQEILKYYENFMSEENIINATKIASYREKNLFQRIKLAFDTKITTPYKKLNIGYRVAIILKYF